jgi:hypothetical protein
MKRVKPQTWRKMYRKMVRRWKAVRDRHFAHKHPHGRKVKKAMMKKRQEP